LLIPPQNRLESAMHNPLEGVQPERDQECMVPAENYTARNMPLVRRQCRK
jgi:hypothetical protein